MADLDNLLQANDPSEAMEENEKTTCQFSLNSSDYPEVKKWKVGQTYQITVREISKTEEADGTVVGRFEVIHNKPAEYGSTERPDDEE